MLNQKTQLPPTTICLSRQHPAVVPSLPASNPARPLPPSPTQPTLPSHMPCPVPPSELTPHTQRPPTNTTSCTRDVLSVHVRSSCSHARHVQTAMYMETLPRQPLRSCTHAHTHTHPSSKTTHIHRTGIAAAAAAYSTACSSCNRCTTQLLLPQCASLPCCPEHDNRVRERREEQ